MSFTLGGLRQSTRAGDFLALMKPRVMSLAIFTAFVGIMTAPARMTPLAAATAIFAIAIGAGAAGALNMWHDADLDAVMSRTAVRPIPSGRVSRFEALVFGLSLSAASILLLSIATNRLAAALLGFTIFFYIVIYSMWLKFATPQNIVIGGAAGALPPMIGWAAATDSVGIESVVLFMIIFLWTPPHFWALALYKASDYAAAGVPMMPNVAGQASTRRQILVYTVLLATAGMLPWAMDFASQAYGVAAAALGGGFVRHAYKAQLLSPRTVSMKAAKTLFNYSILYLYLIYAALLLDTVVARTLLTNGE